MIMENLTVPGADVRKLLAAANADAALLYIYINSGNRLDNAGPALNMSPSRVNCAAAALRQLGMMAEENRAKPMVGERPSYSERDVLEAAGRDNDFEALCGEVQRLLGRNLNVEEMKILLGFVRYLGLPVEVVSMLVSYCKERARQRGTLRNPSLRSIEKEAYHWAELGIDSMESAAAHIQSQNIRNSRLSRLMNLLQIRGRSLTAAEEKYASSWLEMGFEEQVISTAYERTCLNTGGLSWAYMNKILQRWNDAGLKTAEAVRSRDRKPGNAAPTGQRQLDDDERAAIERMLSEV